MNQLPARRIRTASAPSRQRGIALFVGLIFLVVLSLVAVIAMQSTFLEMRMATNVARHEEAFQMSDSMRGIPDAFLDQNVFNAGWPVSWGGSVADNDFDFSKICPSASIPVTASNCALVSTFKTALTSGGTVTPKLLYGSLDAPGANGATIENPTDPSTWVVDVAFNQANPNGTGDIAAKLSFVPDGTVINQGAGAAQAGGYRGLGISVAAGGSAVYFEMQSLGLSPSDGSNGRAVTISQYRSILQ